MRLAREKPKRSAELNRSSQSEFNRSILSGVVGSAAFLGLFLGLDFFWWLALLLSFGVYFGFNKSITPIPEIENENAGPDPGAETGEVVRLLGDYAGRLGAVADVSADSLRSSIHEMSENTYILQDIAERNSTDLRSIRPFINVFLPRIVETVETHARLSKQSGDVQADRLNEMSQSIAEFSPTIARIKAAAVERDLQLLEVEVAVLSERFQKNS